MWRALVVTLATALAGCVTPFQEMQYGYGVSATPLGGDVYRVQAQLNSVSDFTMVQDYLLLRSADAAVRSGAIGFVILGGQDTSRSSTMVVPGSTTTNAYAYGSGNAVYGSATTTYRPTQYYNFTAPGGIITIRLVRQPEPGYFNAVEVVNAIGPRHGVTWVNQSAAPK